MVVNLKEILEVLGLSSNSESMEHVLRLYLNNNARESLLACVLTALSAIVQNCSNETHKQNKTSKTRLKNINKVGDSTLWIEEIRLVLLRAQLTSGQLQQVEDLIRKYVLFDLMPVRVLFWLLSFFHKCLFIPLWLFSDFMLTLPIKLEQRKEKGTTI